MTIREVIDFLNGCDADFDMPIVLSLSISEEDINNARTNEDGDKIIESKAVLADYSNKEGLILFTNLY